MLSLIDFSLTNRKQLKNPLNILDFEFHLKGSFLWSVCVCYFICESIDPHVLATSQSQTQAQSANDQIYYRVKSLFTRNVCVSVNVKV